MIQLQRTNHSNPDFKSLVQQLDRELAFLDGDDHEFYDQFNKIDDLKYVVVAYLANEAVGCGAIKPINKGEMEIKRMYVHVAHRKEGIASAVLNDLEVWAKELRADKCILETGLKQHDAIRLYRKSGYTQIPNYGPYVRMENSLCFAKPI